MPVSSAQDVIVKKMTRASDGRENMNVDGSVTAQAFEFRAADGKIAVVRSVMFYVKDDGQFTADGFGALSGLSAGVEISVRDAGEQVILDITHGTPIKTNAGWSRLSFDTRLDAYGSGANYVSNRMEFVRFTDGGFYISGGEYLEVAVRDDLSGLTEFYATVQGYQVKPRRQ